MAGTLYYVILPFLTACVMTSRPADFDAQHELTERFLTARNLDIAVLYTCWSIPDRMQNMKKLNEKKIMVSYRDKNDFNERLNLEDAFSISLYSPTTGVIVDWSCNEDLLFKFSEHWMWNASYHWLMIMENESNKNIQSFLASKNINLTIWSEVLLAYPRETQGIVTRWHIFDIYRTAFEPRGELMIDVLSKTFGKWGIRCWKYDKRSNLRNLTLNVVAIGNPYGIATKNNNTVNRQPSGEELVKYLKTFTPDRSGSVQKFSYAIMEPLTRIVLNLTMQVKATDSWGFQTDDKWDGIAGMLLSGEVDFSITINAVRTEKFEVNEYSAITSWKHLPCVILRKPRSSTMSVNIFLQPFQVNVWFALIGVMALSTIVYFTIVRFESDQRFSLTFFSDVFLLKIGTLCQQGTATEPKKLSNRFIVLLMFSFSLIVYQFYSSSIISGLLRPTFINIDSAKKLEESKFDVGVENVNYVIKLSEANARIDPYMKKILDENVKPKSEYLPAKEGAKKLKKGNYAFFTDPATTYWILNEIFTEREKCDLTELIMTTPEVTAFSIQKKSPYRKLLNYAGSAVLETGIMNRELQIWHAKKPECLVGKTVTKESLVSVGIKEVKSLFIFLFAGFVVSFTILLLEIIIHHSNINE